MATPPHLIREGDTWKLDISVGTSGRRRFELTDKAESLLVAACGYGNRDVVPWMTAKALVLGGDAYLDVDDYEPLRTAWDISGADGGRKAPESERRALAEHLLGKRYGEDERAALQEHVKKFELTDLVDPREIRSRRDRVEGLQDIARNLER